MAISVQGEEKRTQAEESKNILRALPIYQAHTGAAGGGTKHVELLQKRYLAAREMPEEYLGDDFLKAEGRLTTGLLTLTLTLTLTLIGG